jgi:hypothetical protein
MRAPALSLVLALLFALQGIILIIEIYGHV